MKNIAPDPESHPVTADARRRSHTSQTPSASSPRRLPGALVLAGLCAAFLCWLAPGAARAADANPPGKLTYQGFLTDGSGVPYGNTAPVNQAVVFRIWKKASGTTSSDLVWAEWQTVTIDKGHFSVLLGEGAAEAANAGVFSQTPATTVFTGNDASDRFMEIALANPSGVAQTTISPRLQFQPAPYAALSRSARQVVDDGGNAVLTATAGNVTFTGNVTGNNFNGNGANLTSLNANNLSTGIVPSGRLSGAYSSALTLNNNGNSFTGNGANLYSLNAGQITSGILPDARLSGNVPRLNAANAFSSAFNSFSGSGARFDIPFYAGGLGLMLTSSGSDAPQFRFVRGSDGRHFDIGQNTSGGFTIEDTDVARITITADGNVGIGTTTPSKAKLEVNGSDNSPISNFGYLNKTGASASSSSETRPFSIWASHDIAAQNVYAFSDARIKNIEGRSDSAADLATLGRIEITDYKLKDVIVGQGHPNKKLIAQQVEKVYPQAVSRSTNVVPDIFTKAAIRDGWVELGTNLKKGERVRLIAEKTEGIYEVLEVADGRFRTAFKPAGAEVFVYGREVKDFRQVDYDAISMLNVSATQELARRIDALRKSEARVTELEREVSDLRKLQGEMAELRKLVARITEAPKGDRPAAAIPTSESAK